jgi:cell division protein FtsZ
MRALITGDRTPRIAVVGVGGGGGNAVNTMITQGVAGVKFIAANTDAQALSSSLAEHQVQLGRVATQGWEPGRCQNSGGSHHLSPSMTS